MERKRLGIVIVIGAAVTLLHTASAHAQKRPSPRVFRTRPAIAAPPEPAVEENWQKFDRQDCGFSISFPKVPEATEAKQVEVYPGGNVTYRAVTVQSYANKVFYMVNVREYPQGILNKRTDLAEDFGAWLKYYVLDRVTVLGERKMSYGKYAMVEFVYRPTQQEIVVHRAVVIGDRLYQLLVQFPVGATETSEAAVERSRERIHKFLDSFYVPEEKAMAPGVG